MRTRYDSVEGDARDSMLDELAALKSRVTSLQSAKDESNRREVALEGLIARLERQLEQEKSARKQFSSRALVAEKNLIKERQRAEKFKAAYDSLKSHPVVRAARGIKNPMGILRTSNRIETQKGVDEASKSELGKVSADIENQRLDSTVDETKTIADKYSSNASSLNDEAQALYKQYREQGMILEPAQRLQELATSKDAPKLFGTMHQIILGQARLFEELPSIPPLSVTPVYQPEPDRVMYCAHSTGEYNSNGYSTRTTGLTEAIRDAGLDLFIAARPGYPWDHKTNKKAPKASRVIRDYQGIKTHFNPGVSLRDEPLDKYFQLAADILVREAMMNRPSVIVSASNHITAVPALIAARRLGIPFFYEVRGLWEVTESTKSEEWATSERFELAKRLEALVANNADKVFAITEEVREELVSRGTDRTKIEILPNAANIFQYVPLPTERSAVAKSKRPGEYLLGYAGSLVDYEGLDLLVDAISQLPEKYDNVGVLIVGDGVVLPALIEQVAELGLQDRIRFTGRVQNDKINDYLAIFDAVVCPRKPNAVTELVSPLKPIEAMAAGRPVIGSDVSPIASLLGADGRRGLLFAAGSTEDLANQIMKLADDPKLGQDIGRRARKWTVENRTWPIVAKTFVNQVSRLRHRPASTVQLKDIRLALIADEFTTSTIQRELEVVTPTPEDWRSSLDESPVDALFVESAWVGNNGTWARKVGYYDDDRCADLSALIDYCRHRGIPTIFWNKEDPVHINRFKRTAALFDVVLTTDANCLAEYWDARGSNIKALGSLPFWAQPDIHNPLGSKREYLHTVAYGGSYYGDRYAERSKELRHILEGSRAQGLTIYDRQADNPESPYKFPPVLQQFVQGGLTYDEMVEAYKSHPVHINVNSVNASPTMFSRRVFELAACGTPVISGKSFGVTWMFDGTIPVVRNREETELISSLWMNSEADRVLDAWAALRVSFRKHLAHQRLALALRMGGLNVEVPTLPSVGLTIENLTDSAAARILDLSVRPDEVYFRANGESPKAKQILAAAGIEIFDNSESGHASVVVSGDEVLNDRTMLEDMLVALHYGKAQSVQTSTKDIDVQALPLWLRDEATPGVPTAIRRVENKSLPIENIRLRRPADSILADVLENETKASRGSHAQAQNILVVGHDLKFAGQIMDEIEASGNTLLVDKWDGHAQHDKEQSRSRLEQADVVFCEWSLGNLVWYSKHLRAGQRLVTRFHSQEFFTDYPRNVNYDNVEKIVFVSELVRGMAIQKFGIPAAKTVVIPNAVDTKILNLKKRNDSQFVLGFVGMVPQMKRFDLVLDLLEELRKSDSRFTLRVKGKRPEDYPWMAAREDEMAFYREQYARIEASDQLRDAVVFDPQGDDMADWYRGIGIAVSTSDFESFHFTLADGAASRAVPVGLAWPGAEWLYPNEWLHTDVAAAAQYIQDVVTDETKLNTVTEQARDFTVSAYESEKILGELLSVIID